MLINKTILSHMFQDFALWLKSILLSVILRPGPTGLKWCTHAIPSMVALGFKYCTTPFGWVPWKLPRLVAYSSYVLCMVAVVDNGRVWLLALFLVFLVTRVPSHVPQVVWLPELPLLA